MIPKNIKKGQYFYSLRGSFYEIYRCTASDNQGRAGEKINESFLNPEEARRRVYELNGWTYNKKAAI